MPSSEDKDFAASPDGAIIQVDVFINFEFNTIKGIPQPKFISESVVSVRLVIDFQIAEKYNLSAVSGNLREKLSRTRLAFKQKFEELLQSRKPREEILEELA
ncbi:MAG: hypothetical protein WCC06_00005, partial [Candidatus Aminicenantales bacterium]